VSSFLLGVPVGDGGAEGVVVFEVDRSEVAEDLVLASPEPGKAAVRARASLEEALAGLRPSLTKIVEVLGEIAPEQMTVEFGVKMGGETGVIIAKGTAEVNFKVTLSWNPGPSGDSGNVE
jgi:Trypsin-co-occurring domain 1